MSLRPALLAAAALAAALYASLAFCRWDTGRNQDLSALVRALQHGEDLESHIEASQRRDEARRTLAAEVVAGRMSLREAVEHFRRLDEAEPGYPAGIPRPSGDEQVLCEQVLDFVWAILANQKRFVAAARWYGEAFTAHPGMLSGPPDGHRYQAARAAALAGWGQGQEAADLDETSRAAFRLQARVWLRAELEVQRRLLEQEPAKHFPIVARDLQRWLETPDLAAVRGPEALGRLPESERQAWQQLWADIADTLARAVGMIPPEQRASSNIPLPER